MNSLRPSLSSLAVAAILAACSSSSSAPAPSTGGDAGSNDSGGGTTTDASAADGGDEGGIGGTRPVSVHVPPGYNPSTPAPLLIMLHGYTATGQLEESYLKLTALSDARGFLYAHPDGTVDGIGNHFWNATDACCDLGGTGVDDSTYISTLIDQIKARFSVDAKRVFLVGHSNGAFMSYRMACDHADQIAAIASLAGAMYTDTSKCKPSGPVSILEIHGTADATIVYTGGAIQGHDYPSAQTTVTDWATFDTCTPTPDTTAPAIDLDSSLPGNETTVSKHPGCKPGGAAELWSITGGAHIPTLSATFSSSIVDWLLAHPKP